MNVRLSLPILLVLAMALPLAAQISNQPPMPQWLASHQPVEKEFVVEGKLLKAILFGAGGMNVTLNGEFVGYLGAGAELAGTLDVTKFVRAGKNTLSLEPTDGLLHRGYGTLELRPAGTDKGKSATAGDEKNAKRTPLSTGTVVMPDTRRRVAALLELNGDLARKTWVATDASWRGMLGSSITAEAMDPARSPFDFKKTFDAYNSWQLAKPGAQNRATDPGSFTLLPGFKAEMIRSAQPGEDSWVSMTFDPQGCIVLGKEKRGLLRLDPVKGTTEVIEDTLLECRGLLFVGGVLYANANNSKGLYRLEDKDGDGRFEDLREIVHSEGGVGHGRNHIKLGPDGYIYIAHGNNVLLPTNVSEKSPLKRYANDQVLPNPWDGSMFDGNVELPAGHVLRVKPDGSDLQLVAGGLRNPLDIAFNREGELFTFDADMERDVGASWYMPTRVLHVVPGADFGWRRGTGRYPAYYPDTLPSVVDIGLSSPTAIFFGHGARFPARYQEALFIFDWSYGRIIAVHMQPKGASYRGEQETFISGRPLNVTDGCIGPDGALWFTTGGRGTQSGLYRVQWEGAATARINDAAAVTEGAQVREARHQIETAAATGTSWPALNGTQVDLSDPFMRQAARLWMEALPANDERRKELLVVQGGWPELNACLATVRTGNTAHLRLALSKLSQALWDTLDEAQRLAFLRIIEVALSRDRDYGKALERDLRRFDWLDDAWDKGSTELRREMTKILIYLRLPVILERATELLKGAHSSEDLLFYPMHLRYIKQGWTLQQRRVVFEALNRAEKLNGASSYFKAIADTRADLAAALTPQETLELAAVISPPQPVALAPHTLPGHTFKAWKLADLEPMLEKVSSGRSYEGAKTALISVQCVFCHRVSTDSTLPAGVVGPDLAQVSARFGRRDLLMHILEPSAVIDEKFRSVIVTKVDGQLVAGSLEQEDDERVVLKPNPLAKDVVEIAKAQIKERKVSEVSSMPAGLLNGLKADQILDLLAWFEAGGDPKAKVWK